MLIPLVGAAGFEPATSWSQTRRDDRTTLRPELIIFFISKFLNRTPESECKSNQIIIICKSIRNKRIVQKKLINTFLHYIAERAGLSQLSFVSFRWTCVSNLFLVLIPSSFITLRRERDYLNFLSSVFDGLASRTFSGSHPFFLHYIAERAGFEPAVQLPVRQFSKLVVSATHPSLQGFKELGRKIS